MIRFRTVLVTAACVGLVVLLARGARALVMTEEHGRWPANWPKSLEPLPANARTVTVATGIQQTIYEIRFADRQTFERAWPDLVKLKSPHAPLTLYRTQTPPPRDWGDLLSNASPTVRIYAPSYNVR